MKKFLLFILLFTSACASWNQGSGFQETSPPQLAFDCPEQWTRLNTPKYRMYTKDGPFSQYILIQQRPTSKPFRHTKRSFSRGMLPQEAAEVILDEIGSDRAVLSFHVLENNPATVNDYEGFRILFTYMNENGLRFKTLYYGFLRDELFYSIRYNARERKYSSRDLATFERVVRSVRIFDPGQV